MNIMTVDTWLGKRCEFLVFYSYERCLNKDGEGIPREWIDIHHIKDISEGS